MKHPLPDLENRFLPPENWESGAFSHPETGHHIHYNFIKAPTPNMRGNVAILPGLSEFGEKYIETARFFYDQGYGVYIIDWAYQGRSTRYRDNPHKRHSDGFDQDVLDLNYFIENIIDGDQDIFILAHSMGGNIALRYLSEFPNTIKAAAFSAPMLEIRSLKFFGFVLKATLRMFRKLGFSYVSKGHDWHESNRKSDGTDIFSHDPVRDQVHNKWSLAYPELQVGSPTFKWLREALVSIGILKNKKTLGSVNTPILMACADKDVLVCNDIIERAVKYLPQAKLLKFKNAHHEILMEKDDVRDQFLNETLKLFKK